MDDTIVLHNFQTDGDTVHDKLYIVRVDLVDAKTFRVVAAYGKSTQNQLTEQSKGGRSTFDQAYRLAESLADKKVREGYVNMRSPAYRDRCPKDRRRTIMPCMQKIDTSRLALTGRRASLEAGSDETVERTPVEAAEENHFAGPARRERTLEI